jgi:hypothetical protein
LIAIAVHAALLRSLLGHLTDGERQSLAWLAPGALLAMAVVGGSGIPGGRLLVVPDIGLSALVGVLLRAGLSRADTHRARFATRAVCVIVALVHFAVAPLLVLRETASLERRGRAAEAAARDAEIATEGARVAFVVASDPIVFLYVRGVLADLTERSICWSTLATGRAPYRVTRSEARAFSLDGLDRPLLGGYFETLFRSRERAFSVGDAVEQCGATLRVAAIREGRPTRLEVELDHAPPSAIVLLTWRDGRLARTPLPELRATTEIAWEPGPMERGYRASARGER